MAGGARHGRQGGGQRPVRGRRGQSSASSQGRGTPPSGGRPRTGNAPRKSNSERSLGGEQVEGRQAIREMLIAGRRKVREIWIAGDIDAADVIDDIRELAADSRVQVLDVARKRIEQAARSEAPQGVIAFAAPLPEADFDELLVPRGKVNPFLVALDGVTDPGNLGAFLRCCDGAGVTGVILPKHRSVHITPTAAKAAAGAIEHLDIAVVPGLPNAMERMKKARVWTIGLDDEAGRSLFEIGELARDPVCMILGAEGKGLSRLVRERCDLVVSIPMQGQLSSLNVSVAGALATYEILRNRRP
ncbi:MAG: 23S rRNA (guanosine(2251)-2'-O)-methyltransferase RlmB [Actinobacteria bacterium]|nr:23S rRNA (guanosine(2251)-2'-O)-methyltransferase RlmB [Actinomycetota bacterium]